MQPSVNSQILTLCVPHTHPSLPGHFPGRPIVPGVVLLDYILSSAEQWLQRPLRVRTLLQVKFAAPLLPDQTASLEVAMNHDQLRFTLTRAENTIAQGIFKLDVDHAARDPA